MNRTARPHQRHARDAAVRRVLDSLRRVVRDLRLNARRAEREAGITGAQLFVLEMLAESPATSLKDLADRTLTDQSSVSVVVHRLAQAKLVEKREATADARRVELRLTAAGKRLLARCPEPTQPRLIASLARMSAADLAALDSGMAALVREMNIEGSPPTMFFEERRPARGDAHRRRSDEGGAR